MAAPAVRLDARERLLVAAERLIALRGMEVPLRDIAAEAGQRNNSAVHYYFGSRDGLIRAIIERRQAPQEARRLELLAAHEAAGLPDDVAALIAILVAPLFHVPYEDGATHYARFLEQVRTHPVLSSPGVDLAQWPASQIVTTRLQRALPGLSPTQRRLRLASLATVMFALMADRERLADAAGVPLNADSPGLADIVAMLVGLVTA